MDNISTGLDSATTYDIINALKIVCHELGSTYLISLLQVKLLSSYLYIQIIFN